MRQLAVLMLAALAAVSLSGESFAGSVHDFYVSFSENDSNIHFTASGTLEATLNSGSTDQYTVTGVTNITISGIPGITSSDTFSIVPVKNPSDPTTPAQIPNTSGIFQKYNNQLYLTPGAGFVDSYGILLEDSNGVYYEVYNADRTGGGSYEISIYESSTPPITYGPANATLSAVPEPSTLVLAATALVPAIVASRRYRA